MLDRLLFSREFDNGESEAGSPNLRKGEIWARTKARMARLRRGPGDDNANGEQLKAELLRAKTETNLAPSDPLRERPRVKGKFLFVKEEKFWVRGVTYGTFRPIEDGAQFPAPAVVERDFIAMRAAGLNSVRVYTVPPPWLLDLAAANGLRLMIGLPWEQHIAFLDDKVRVRDIAKRVEEYVQACAGHPAVLCYAVGNEIPASVVRWHGKRRVERFIDKLCRVLRRVDPDALLTYVNYPTTEYLELPFVDFISFNVYLESRAQLAAYVGRLQNLAGERPLLLTEVGLDSRRNGEEEQAKTLEWQIEAIFAGGCAGAFVFAWTDEWHRGGYDIEDWDFGLTTRDRRAKAALGSVVRAFKEIPFRRNKHWPRISVAVCSHNGSVTIDETLTALSRLDYPDYEVIVVDDGSTDGTAAIARKHGISPLQSENKGLSNARNLAMEAAAGEIIAYIDDDAYPDPDWLKFLAASFVRTDHVGIGGPNLAPPDDGLIANSVAHAPGGPVHVLLSDEIAEHIPGCNMAYRLDKLREIGGFDIRFRIAGDDVDICWRFQERGWTLGFSPAAVVWHHRRNSIRAYWKQQKEYARAEALLAEKWPQKYNGAGHVSWTGRLYGAGVAKIFWMRSRIYHGSWGSALFQSIYEPTAEGLSALPLMPEWYVVVLLLGWLALLGFSWPPLFLLVPVFTVAVMLSLAQAVIAGATVQFRSQSPLGRLASNLLVAQLHLIQPLARLLGRVRHGLGPWGRTDMSLVPVPVMCEQEIWSEEWQSGKTRLATIQSGLLCAGAIVTTGGSFCRWDLSVSGGLFGSIRAIALVEEHGAGKQLFRLRAWPKVPGLVLWFLVVISAIATLAGFDRAWLAAALPSLLALGVVMLIWLDCTKAMTIWTKAIEEYRHREEGRDP